MFEGLVLLPVALIVVAVLVVLVVFRALRMLKAFSYLFGAVLGVTCVISALLLWETRIAAVPGSYQATGVWGYSTLILRADQTATQEVQFMEYDQPEAPPYKQHPTRHAIGDFTLPVLLTLRVLAVCKDFVMAFMRPRLLVERSQA